eukprot:988925-Prymnesium_polylepis.1
MLHTIVSGETHESHVTCAHLQELTMSRSARPRATVDAVDSRLGACSSRRLLRCKVYIVGIARSNPLIIPGGHKSQKVVQRPAP